MSVQYQYIRVSDGETEKLSVVDEKMCEAQGIAVSDKTYCGFFQSMLYMGMAVAMRSEGGMTTSKAGFDAYKAEKGDEFDSEAWALIERFTVTEYNYTCWR